MVTALLIVGATVGFGVAVITFVLNSRTPLQLGPVPFFGGTALFVLCLVAVLARHLVWR